MQDSEVQPAGVEPSIPKRRRGKFRFSLRTLLLFAVTAGTSGLLGMTWNPWPRVLSMPLMIGGILHIEFSPDGERLLVAEEYEGRAHVCEARTGKMLFSTPVHTYYMRAAAFAPDGQSIMTAGDDPVRLWSLTSDKVTVFKSPDGYGVDGAWLSPDGGTVAAAIYVDDARQLMLWDTRTGALRAQLEGSKITDLNSRYARFSSDGRLLLAAGMNNTARIWDVATGQEKQCFKGHTKAVWDACFSPDGKHVLTGSDDGTAALWDATTGARAFTVFHWLSRVQQVSYSDETGTILGVGGNVLVGWRAANGGDTDVNDSPSTEIIGLHGRRVVTIGYDAAHIDTIRIIDLQTGALLQLLTAANGISGAALSPDGHRIAAISNTSAAISDTSDKPVRQLMVWSRRRPEFWWGVFWLPAFWLTALLGAAFIWSLWRDRRIA